METMQGSTVGAYEVKDLIGKGGMGEVYLAEHTLLGRRVAIKFLLRSLSADEELVERFFTEAKATTAVADPGIVQIFDFGHHVDGSAYIVMEYLEGQSLDNRLVDGTFAEDIALHMARHLANSLAAAHRAGVIHRDLKLENVFLVADPAVPGGERPKILDFGLAKLSRAEPGRSKTRTGVIMGTPIYMSPEQCKGAHDVDERSDLYSLGCLLYCMVLARPPFDYESAGELIAAHLREPPPVPSSTRFDLSPEFDRIIARCLAKDPAARYQSMAELSAAITDVLGDAASISRPPSSQRIATIEPPPVRAMTQLARPTTLSIMASTSTTPPPPRRTRRALFAIAGLMLAAAGGMAVSRVAADDGAAPRAAIRPAAAAVAPTPTPIVEPIVLPVPIVLPELIVIEPDPIAAPAIEPAVAPPRSGKRARRPASVRAAAPRPAAASAAEARDAANMDRGD